ncbi:MAG: M3 family metallopeptidase, partial [Deferribacteraceae bacterium]|nr:M3 family metallopeptidase [Deferribacteraceae bacterium]
CLTDTQKKLNTIIEENRAALKALLTIDKKTYMNFVRPFMDMDARLSDFFTPVAHLQGVKNSQASQEAFASCIEPITIYSTELGHNKDLYNAFIAIRKGSTSLTAAQAKVLDDTILAFELEGVSLPDDAKERVKAINIRLGELSNDFSQNLLDATNAYKITITDPAMLGSMPESDRNVARTEYMESLAEGEPIAASAWTFTLQMPSYIAFMTYVPDRAKREEVYKAYATRAPQNGALITEIMALRDEKAHILGCANFAEMNLKTMSAPSVAAVNEFSRKLAKAGKPFAKDDMDEMGALAAKDGVKPLLSHDTAYYSDKLKKLKYEFDEEQLRPYFEKERTLAGLFAILEKLFGITFKEKPAKLWDDKARFYELYRDKAVIGGLYLDLEARPDKNGGAWMNEWHTHYKDAKDELHLPEAYVVGNFPVSQLSLRASQDGQPSLLRHDDVSTLFHEMGHALHHLLSTVDEYNVSGVHGIDWDTVEFPSQFLENFAYAPEVLDILAKHYKTDEPLPSELRDRLVAARNYQAGFALVRQVEFGLFDMLIHMQKLDEAGVQKVLDSVRQEVAVIIPPAYNKFQHSFSHIFSGGYAAGYYSYKWAEMLSSDAYYAFMERGIFNKELAVSYRDTVLSLGSSKKMDAIYRDFLGRDPDPEAILKHAGLL